MFGWVRRIFRKPSQKAHTRPLIKKDHRMVLAFAESSYNKSRFSVTSICRGTNLSRERVCAAIDDLLELGHVGAYKSRHGVFLYYLNEEPDDVLSEKE